MHSPFRAVPALLLTACAAAAQARCVDIPAPATPLLHVPSPDWRDQVIYFALIDRYDDGVPANDDQGAGEYDPADPAKYSGGDLCGLARRVAYMRDLGATALWITPPVAHQWWDPVKNYGGYHGYWAQDFSQVDAHFGTLDDYRTLSDALHRQGMYLVQDIVVNHVGNYFRYSGGWDAADPARYYVAGAARPTQQPFAQNDPRDPAQRAAAIYHWTPEIVDFTDRRQERNWQLADLDDLNTENADVRRALRASYGGWIRDVGVDAFRIDTAFYVPPEFFRDFLHSTDRAAPGVLRVAAQTGRTAFHAFGEGFGLDAAFDDRNTRKIDAYLRDGRGPLLPGMLDFPLYGTLLDVFARGRPPAELGWRIARRERVHGDVHLMPSFVDNHDVDRFLASGDVAGLKQALLAILTLPGIPVIYYGTEQGYTQPRAAMFARGVGADGRDHFDRDAPLYGFLQKAIALRREHRVFSRGTPTVLRADAAGTGALAWRMRDGADEALVVFNTGADAVLLDGLDVGPAAQRVLQGAFGIDGPPADLAVGAGGRVHLVLPPRSGQVWIAQRRSSGAPEVAGPAPPEGPQGGLVIDPLPKGALHADVVVTGRAAAPFALVLDGNLAHAQQIAPGADGRWKTTLAVGGYIDAAVEHRLVAWDAARRVASAARTFRVAPQWREVAVVDDPPGDDIGPSGTYVYPTDPSWRDHRTLDLRRVRASTAGAALRLEVTLGDLVAAWNPPQGYDHLALTVYVALPDRSGGAREMPLQYGQLPGDLRWHYRLRTGGWTSAWTSSAQASATNEGTPRTPAPTQRVDRAAKTVTLLFPAAAFEGATSLSGAHVVVTTWDYDGGYRALAPEAGAQAFGGGDVGSPRVMDLAEVVIP